MLFTAYRHPGPSAIRYPRGTGPESLIEHEMTELPIGKGVVVRPGNDVAILNFGALFREAMAAGEELDATVVDMRWVKPLDEDLIEDLARSHRLLITLEENAIAGGAGSGVAELLRSRGIDTPIRHCGIADSFIEHGDQDALRRSAGASRQQVLDQARSFGVGREQPLEAVQIAGQ
jgi:1-deoxy-D-xylulose-5-phosphate synthase